MLRLAILAAISVSMIFVSTVSADESLTVKSPNQRLSLTLLLSDEGEPAFQVRYRDTLAGFGTLGLEFAKTGRLGTRMKIVETARNTRDETYSIAVGKASSARDQHHELLVTLQEQDTPGRKLQVALRAYDDGVAFRYLISQQESPAEFILTDESTRFRFPGTTKARLLPLNSYHSPYEKYYETRELSDISTKELIGLPLLLERPLPDGTTLWTAVTEANLTDYAGMYLSRVEGEPETLVSRLSPLPGRTDGAKVIGQTPHASPWRVLMMADDPGRLIESNLIFHLSDPPAIEDTSWIKPGKTMFPWWNHYMLENVDFQPGVNTDTMKHYIDFCAEQGIPYHSLDGLDIAWYGGPIAPKGPTDVTTAAPSIDIEEILDYAKRKGVRLRLWMHWKALQPQIDEAFATFEKWGIEGVMVDFMDRDDQEMVRFYHEMAEKAARHHLTVTLHGAYKPTGMERTWPNVLTYEAVLNQEYNKWRTPGGQGASPAHNLNVGFIRMLAGPLDYHQGGMRNVLPEDFHYRDVAPPVQGTRGHQLAMYVVYQNHLPMLADYPEAYRDQAGWKFLVDVPTTWDETRVLHAEIEKCLVIARRKGTVWYLGGMTAGEERIVKLPLRFLGSGSFEAELWLDHPAKGPTAITREQKTLSAGGTLSVTIPSAGGFVAKLRPQN